MLERFLYRMGYAAKLRANDDVVSAARAFAVALSQRDDDALEQQLTARSENEMPLAHERTRRQELQQQLMVRSDKERLLVQELEKQLAARIDNEKLLAQERARSQELARELAAWVDIEKLMAQERARSLELVAARRVFEQAAVRGSALALFLLAETYDPAMLSAWGILRRRGNLTKAQELYARANASGIHEASKLGPVEAGPPSTRVGASSAGGAVVT